MLIISVVLAKNGNEMAWKRSKGVIGEDFDNSQKIWKKIGIIGLVLTIIINAVVLVNSDSISFNFGRLSSSDDYYNSYYDDPLLDTVAIDNYDDSLYY